MDAIQVARERLKIIKLSCYPSVKCHPDAYYLRRCHPDAKGGRLLRRRVCPKANAATVLARAWLSRLARRKASMLRPCLHGHNRAKELGLCPIQ